MVKRSPNHQFLCWLKAMEVNYWEAAVLLKTTVSRVEGYALGTLPITPKHSRQCRLLLKLRGRGLPFIRCRFFASPIYVNPKLNPCLIFRYEGRRGAPALAGFPHHGRIQALFNHGPLQRGVRLRIDAAAGDAYY